MKTSKAALLAGIAEKIEQWEKSKERMESGYAYEKTFVEMWQSLGREVLQESVGKVPKGRNGKKNSKPVQGKSK